jgi:hypothetical protein
MPFAEFFSVTFNTDDDKSLRARGSLGDMRRGEPYDTLKLIGSAARSLPATVDQEALMDKVKSVVIESENRPAERRNYTRDDLKQMMQKARAPRPV